MPTATVCKVQPPHHASLSSSAPSHQSTNLLNSPSQTWPADAAMALWVMGPACAMGSCLMYWPPPSTSPPSTGCAGTRGVWDSWNPWGGSLLTALSPHHFRCCWAMPMLLLVVLTSWISWTMSSPTRHSSFLSMKALWITW